MKLFDFILHNVRGNPGRAALIFSFAFFVSLFAFLASTVILGTQRSLSLGIDRLGADLLVVPRGTEAKIEGALLTGKPASAWLPYDNYPKIAGLPGVAKASPQIFLSTLEAAPCCAASEMFLIAIDPSSDFTIRPWLEQRGLPELGPGEAIGGSLIFEPKGDEGIVLFGYKLKLLGNLESTGTGLDQTMFISADTAREMARVSLEAAQSPLLLPDQSISAVLVRLEPGESPVDLEWQIRRLFPDLSPVKSSDLYRRFKDQLGGILSTLFAVLAGFWLLYLVSSSSLFALSLHARRREIGVLRALGARKAFIVKAFLYEALAVTLSGTLLAYAVSESLLVLFKDAFFTQFGLPFFLPGLGENLAVLAVGLGLAGVGALLASLLPALRFCAKDAADTLRE